jgi:hypothetical protein
MSRALSPPGRPPVYKRHSETGRSVRDGREDRRRERPPKASAYDEHDDARALALELAHQPGRRSKLLDRRQAADLRVRRSRLLRSPQRL